MSSFLFKLIGVARSRVRFAGSSRNLQAHNPVRRRDEVPHQGLPGATIARETHEWSFSPVKLAMHDGRTDHAEHAAVPLAVAEPAQRIGQQRQPRKQRQQEQW